MSKKKIAVWGIGKHAINNILPALTLNKNLDLYGIYTRNQETLNTNTKKFNCKTWNNSNEMLSDPDLDIIYIATPIGKHAEQSIKVLESNKHCWCEKPFTSSYKDTKKIINIARTKKLSVAEGFMYLYHPQYQWLQNYINNYKNEEIKIINCYFTIPYTRTPGFRYNPELGGSTLLDIGTYLLSAIFGLINNEEPIISQKIINKDKGYDVDMNGYTCLKYRSGIICHLHWGMGYGYRNDIDILMNNGSIYTENIFSKPKEYIPEFKIKDLHGDISIHQSDKCNHFDAMFNHFYKLISDKEKARKEEDRILHLAKWTDKIKTMDSL